MIPIGRIKDLVDLGIKARFAYKSLKIQLEQKDSKLGTLPTDPAAPWKNYVSAFSDLISDFNIVTLKNKEILAWDCYQQGCHDADDQDDNVSILRATLLEHILLRLNLRNRGSFVEVIDPEESNVPVNFFKEPDDCEIGIRRYVGKLVCNLLSRTPSTTVEDLSYIDFSMEDGLQLYFKDLDYAKKVGLILDGDFDAVLEQVELNNKFGTFVCRIKLKDYNEIKRFCTDILNLTTEDRRDLYHTFNLVKSSQRRGPCRCIIL